MHFVNIYNFIFRELTNSSEERKRERKRRESPGGKAFRYRVLAQSVNWEGVEFWYRFIDREEKKEQCKDSQNIFSNENREKCILNCRYLIDFY